MIEFIRAERGSSVESEGVHLAAPTWVVLGCVNMKRLVMEG
jgi:hypothetical protein